MLGAIPIHIKEFNTINKDGKRWRYTGFKNGKKVDAVKYFKSTMITDETLSTAAPGIYTWILKGDTFYANKVLTPQEIGSLHFVLDLLSDIDANNEDDEDIEAAGEMIVSDNGSIIFNFLSGTYYKSFAFKKQKRKLVQKSPEEMRDLQMYVLVKMKELGVDNVSYDDSGNTFIAKDMIVNNSTLAKLNEYVTRVESQSNASEGGKRRTRRARKIRRARKTRASRK
jgi:hypothetical protein